MSDVHNRKTRSYNMSRIKGKDTKPEMMVRRFLFAQGFRYRLHDKKLPGKPDIVLKKYNTVIFVNGCFWHGHEGCRYFKIPATKQEWWKKKISDTKKRDLKNHQNLIKDGWNVIIIWECQINEKANYEYLKLIMSNNYKNDP